MIEHGKEPFQPPVESTPPTAEPVQVGEVLKNIDDIIGAQPDPLRAYTTRKQALEEEIADIDARRNALREQWDEYPAAVPDIDEVMQGLNDASMRARADLLDLKPYPSTSDENHVN